MSVLGQTRKSALVTAVSAFAPKATKLRTSREVRFVPISDIAICYSITFAIGPGKRFYQSLPDRRRAYDPAGGALRSY